MARNTTRIPYVLPLVLMVLLGKPGLNQGFAHRSLLETCRPNGAISSKTDHSCNTENGSVCCKAGRNYSTYDCSPPVTGRTPARLMLNSFAEGGDGGAASECTGEFYSDKKMVAALSTGWYNRGSRCEKYVQIRANGRSVKAMVVDEWDSMHGCDADHNYGPPCENNVVNGSPAVWDALGLNKDAGEVQITWSDEQRHLCNAISYI